MTRWIAGIAAVFLLVAGAVFALQGHAEAPGIAPAPEPRLAAASGESLSIPDAPEADAKGKEQRRFARADANEDGKLSMAELMEPRRKSFGKLDVDHDGRLSFEEWAA
ncbi:EF-hand domain-containing protein [Sphingomonas sp. RB56-2]|uniref:EF-hand domain-containing protein n=1 Tax=Sphingomonas brevis TaxID=2908206 RepID=A0ABT0S7Y6_9SPHN|nr:EF-hand domain-containing protein [Sphingomonas brevis]MCL6740234.1 EF-hand domain-containing protein [Sphingomonas brevis]